jgi:hypothetical protein
MTMEPSQGPTSAWRRPPEAPRLAAALATLLLVLGAGQPAPAPQQDPAPDAYTTVVDSIFPIEEELRRFRSGLEEVTSLADGASSRDELVERFLVALERGDTTALAPLLLTRAEFAYLYYPHTVYTRPPYELSPGLLWFQMENLTSRGLTRMLKTFGGRALNADGYVCEEPPSSEGPGQVWSECRIVLAPPSGERTTVRLFGSILGQGGRFKFVTYSADL